MERSVSRAQLKKFLREIGWREQRMSGGGYLFMEFDDRILTINPQVWGTYEGQDKLQIDLNAGVTTRRFQDYCSFVLEPKEKGGFAFFRPQPPIRMFVSEVSRDIAFDTSAKAISWVKRLDLWECLRTNLTYTNDAAPLFSIYRFIALRMEGRVSELERILSDLRKWDKGGFDPNVTAEEVERAIALDVSGGL
jgi:hypothetical protein